MNKPRFPGCKHRISFDGGNGINDHDDFFRKFWKKLLHIWPSFLNDLKISAGHQQTSKSHQTIVFMLLMEAESLK